MKTNKTIYWITTMIIFLFEGVIPLFYWRSEEALAGLSHLGYPEYFATMLLIFKVIGGLLLILPQVQPRLKEWAYAGFAFDFIAATYSHVAIDGFTGMSFFPLIFLVILMISYYYYHYKLGRFNKEYK